MDHWPINNLEEIFNNHHISTQIINVEPNSMDFSAHASINLLTKILKTNALNSSANSSSPHEISFSNPNYETQPGTIKPKENAVPTGSITTLPSGVLVFQESLGNQISGFKACLGSKRKSTHSEGASTCQEHVMSERKRREKINQRLIALSALVPGLKKMDKASVLGDAIDYLKKLQEQVKTLQEQASDRKSMESVAVYGTKCELRTDHNLPSENNNYPGSGGGDGNSGAHYAVPVVPPEIVARSCDKDVLIKIHCVKSIGVVEKTVAEIEKLHLSVASRSVISFGSSVLDMTITAQMDDKFSLTMVDLVKNLHAALKLVT